MVQRNAPRPAPLPRAIWVLGTVSFLSDVASDMIYPLLPLFLTTVLGAGALALGTIEGIAETTASLLKVASGILSDRTKRRSPIVVAGYTVSSLMRPLMGLAWAWPQILVLRFLDRIGKGVRTSPRDALIADVTPEAQQGQAFGLQIGLDHGGAVVGPLVGWLLVGPLALTLRTAFMLAAVPGALTILVLVVGLREPQRRTAPSATRPPLWSNWGNLGPAFKRYLVPTGVLALASSSDAFLLLQLDRAGLSAGQITLLWAAFNLIRASFSVLAGRLVDRWGPRPLLIGSWVLYGLVYLAFALTASPSWLAPIFLVYGLFYGFAESSELAWVARLVPATLRGSGFGFYHALIGMTALPASVGFGVVMARFGAPVAFMSEAMLTFLGVLLLLGVPTRPQAQG